MAELEQYHLIYCILPLMIYSPGESPSVVSASAKTLTPDIE